MNAKLSLVEGSDAIRDFAEAPFRIRDARYAAGASPAAWTVDFVSHAFPFDRAHWLARDGGTIVGRVGANVSTREPKRGFVGFYECALDHPERDAIHRALLATAEAWLRDRGVAEVYGPVDYQTWFPYRFRTAAPDGTPDFPKWEPVQPPEYPALWEASGYAAAERYTSKCSADLPSAEIATKPYYDRCWEAGFRFRPFREGADFAKELPIIQSINQRAFKPEFLTEAIDPTAYAKLYVPQFASLIDRYSFFAVAPDGKDAGYFFVYGDQGHFVWKTVAVAAEYQRLGVGAFGMHHGVRIALKDGFTRSIAALVKDRAPSEGLTSKPASYVWTHEYAVFRKTL